MLTDETQGKKVAIHTAVISNITLTGPFEADLPLLVGQHFGKNAQVYGLLMTLSATGSLVVALWIGHRKRLRRRGYLVYGAWLLASSMLALMGLPFGLVGPGLAACLWGVGITTLGLAWTNSLQELVPAERLGRVASIDALGSYALLPVGYALAGIAADRLGASPVFLLGGILSTFVIALGLLHPAVRGLD